MKTTSVIRLLAIAITSFAVMFLVPDLAAQGHGGGMGGGGNGGGMGGGDCGGDSTGHGGGMHDSLEVITASGIVLIDSTEMGWNHDSTGHGGGCNDDSSGHGHGNHGFYGHNGSGNSEMDMTSYMDERDFGDSLMLVYFLDEDEDGEADYVLNFGPPWYTPEDSTLTRPEAGEYITVSGYLMTESPMWDFSVIIVTELNGQPWRDFDGFGHGGRISGLDRKISYIGSHGNFPNPFNPSTTVTFEILEASKVKVTIYDILGREVNTLMNRYAVPGTYNVVWDGSGIGGSQVAAGLYLYRISTNTSSVTKLINYLK